uniref:MULE transposase domain-containing protein n=1 Tax=Panagrolaimus davidi TaxID=227884 RepID=A0A914Q8E7_9BILA
MATRVRDTTERVIDVVEHVRTNVPVAVQNALPDKPSLLRGAHRVRQKLEGNAAAPKSLEELVVPDELVNIALRDADGGDDREEPFVVHDSGPDTGNRRFLIFSCTLLLTLLQSAANWFLDATFKTVPNLTYQLLVVHAQWADTHITIPCAYILLNNKDQDIYKDALSALRRLVNNASPENVMMDFELGLHNDQQFAKSIAMFRALAFLPVRDVSRGFVLLKRHLEDTYSERAYFDSVMALCDYFEENYIGTVATRNRRNIPRFPQELWNVHEKTLEGSPKTNNTVEGGHNKLHSFFDCDHPSFFRFIRLLRNFTKTLVADVYDLRAGKKINRPMTAQYRLLEHRRRNLVENYHPNNIFDFLESMAGLLALH